MARQYSGQDAALYVDGAKVGRVTAWELSGNVDALETTTLGDFARSYMQGIESYSGSLTLLYYETDANAIDGGGLLDDVFRTTTAPTTTHSLELRLSNGSKTRSLGFKAVITDSSISASVGEIITAELSFNVTGPLTTATVI
jgi:hypothetical protein